MTRYASGRRAEWRARDWFRRRGYTVIRSAGSKGLVDLVAWREKHAARVGTFHYADVVFVQVKYTRSFAGAWKDDNWRAFAGMTLPEGVARLAMIYRHGNTTPEEHWG